MMVSIIFIIITIVVETGLFIIKQDRDDKTRKKIAKQSNKLQMGPPNPSKNLGK